MKKLLLQISLLYIIAFSSVLKAQMPVYRTINNLNGLLTNTVYEVIQDKEGFIWLGHDKGLSRYDGKNFKHYNNPSKQGRSLSNLMLYNGTIWSQDFSGNYYFTQNDSIVKEERLTGKGSFTAGGIIQNELVAPSADSLRILNLKTNRFKVLKLGHFFMPVPSYSKDALFSSSNNGILIYKEGKLTFLKQPLPGLFFLQKVNGYFIGCSRNKYPYIYTIKSNQVQPISVLKEGLFILEMTVIDDEIWISTSTGAYCFNKDFTPKYNGVCFFEGSSISKVFKDREGNYWFTSLNKGVFLVVNMNLQMFGKKSIASLAWSKNKLLVGTSENELMSFDGSNLISELQEKVFHEIVFLLKDTLSGKLFSCSYELKIYDKNLTDAVKVAAKNVSPISKDYFVLSYNAGASIVCKNDKLLPEWLRKYTVKSEQKNFYPINIPQGRGRWVLWNAKDSLLYIANSAGLFCISPAGLSEIKNKNNSIYVSQMQLVNGLLYAATYNEGMVIIKKDKYLSNMQLSNGVTNYTIYKFTISDQHLWMLSDEAILRYDLESKQTSKFNYTDGLPRAEIKDIFIKNGLVYLATTDGLSVFKEGLGGINYIPPLLKFNQFNVNGKSFHYYDNLDLNANQNSVDINFSVLSYRGADEVKVRYQINEMGWIFLPAGARTLSLPSLSSGQYTVKIQALNEDGIQSSKSLVFSFQVAVPFYKSWWFILLNVIGIILVVYVYFRFRINDINIRNDLVSQKLRLEQELHQSTLASIKSQMNPHFIFNALNTIQSYIYANDRENASEYLSKFSDLTRMILEMSNRERISLTEEIKALNLYLELEQQRFEDKLHYSISLDENVNPDFCFIPSMLIQPYVENAIKHGLLHKKDNRLVSISFQKSVNGIIVIIDDNGIGRRRSSELQKFRQKKHQSFAIAANRKRLDILNKGLSTAIDIEIIDKINELGQAIGTKVQLHIPTLTHSDN